MIQHQLGIGSFLFFSYFSLIFQYGIPFLAAPPGLLEGASRNHTLFIQVGEDKDVLKYFEPNNHVWIEVENTKLITLDVLLRRGYEISPKEVDKVIASLTENKKNKKKSLVEEKIKNHLRESGILQPLQTGYENDYD